MECIEFLLRGRSKYCNRDGIGITGGIATLSEIIYLKLMIYLHNEGSLQVLFVWFLLDTPL